MNVRPEKPHGSFIAFALVERSKLPKLRMTGPVFHRRADARENADPDEAIVKVRVTALGEVR